MDKKETDLNGGSRRQRPGHWWRDTKVIKYMITIYFIRKRSEKEHPPIRSPKRQGPQNQGLQNLGYRPVHIPGDPAELVTAVAAQDPHHQSPQSQEQQEALAPGSSLYDSSTPFRLFDPSRLSMRHSYSMSFFSGSSGRSGQIRGPGPRRIGRSCLARLGLPETRRTVLPVEAA